LADGIVAAKRITMNRGHGMRSKRTVVMPANACANNDAALELKSPDTPPRIDLALFYRSLRQG
jgi:hypothetical protein